MSSNDEQPIAYVDGKPIYADGRKGSGHGFETPPEPSIGSGDSPMAPLDDSGGRRLKRAMKLVTPLLVVLGIIGSGVVGVIGDARDAVKDVKEQVTDAIEEAEKQTQPGSPTSTVPVAARGQYVWYVDTSLKTFVNVNRGGPNGPSETLFVDTKLVNGDRLSRLEGRRAMLSWEERGGGLIYVVAVRAARPGESGTPPTG